VQENIEDLTSCHAFGLPCAKLSASIKEKGERRKKKEGGGEEKGKGRGDCRGGQNGKIPALYLHVCFIFVSSMTVIKEGRKKKKKKKEKGNGTARLSRSEILLLLAYLPVDEKRKGGGEAPTRTPSHLRPLSSHLDPAEKKKKIAGGKSGLLPNVPHLLRPGRRLAGQGGGKGKKEGKAGPLPPKTAPLPLSGIRSFAVGPD